ncbi:MAG: tetratricopeptide repeat protein, partial [Streptosporangiaceae bacterium]
TALADLLARLRGGRTLVLLGSRDPGAADALRLASAETYALSGLDPQSATLLSEHILRRQSGPWDQDDNAERVSLEDLVTVLAGSPRSISLVLPALAATPPSAVLAALATGGEAADRGGRIRAAMADSFARLAPPMRRALLLLAPFTAVISTGAVLDAYGQRLSGKNSIAEFAPGDLEAALDQAAAAGLVMAHPQLDDYVQVQPLLPYFLRSALADQPQILALAEKAHYQVYSDLGPELGYLLTAQDDPQKRSFGRAVTEAEYFNLVAALRYGLRAGRPVVQLLRALDEYLDQAERQDTRRGLAAGAIEAFSGRTGQDQQRELAQLRGIAGDAARASGDSAEALRQYQAELEIQRSAEDRRGMAVSYYQLGQLARDSGAYEPARDSYRHALEVFLDLDEHRYVGAIYLALGSMARDHGSPAEAEDYVRRALQVFQESGERRAVADCHYQLGLIAQGQWELDRAEDAYRQALEVSLEFGDSNRAAAVYTRLGFIAREQERYGEAEADTRRALDLHLRAGNRYQLAEGYGQLGLIAQAQGRPAEAEASYRQALDIFLEFGNGPAAAVTLFSLGNLAGAQERYAQAERSYRQAVDLLPSAGHNRLAAEAHLQLGRLAEAQGRQAEAEVSYLAALDQSQELPDEKAQSSIATNVGLALARLGNHD